MLAADAVEFIERHGLGPAVVLGHSMGGKVGMRLALEHSELVSQLVVVDISPTKQSQGLRPVLDAMLAIEPGNYASREEVDRALGEKISDQRLRQFLLTNVERGDGGAFRWRLNLPAIDTHFEELAAAIDSNESYPGPTLFVRGGRSDYVRDNDLDTIRRLFPSVEVATVPGAGHWVHAEAPAALVRVVTDFLSRTSASG